MKSIMASYSGPVTRPEPDPEGACWVAAGGIFEPPVCGAGAFDACPLDAFDGVDGVIGVEGTFCVVAGVAGFTGSATAFKCSQINDDVPLLVGLWARK